MPQSLANILVHLVFSTKHREAFIDANIEIELHSYVATLCNTLKCPAHKIGGTDDHIHIACSLARTVTIAELVQNIKQDSSKWIKTRDKRYREFAWQNGYGAFSIGQGQLDHLRRYIENQREHHTRHTFQEEYREILRRYGIEWDERYVWD